MWLGAPQTTQGQRGEETRWYFRNPRRTGPPVKMPWAGAVVAQGWPWSPARGSRRRPSICPPPPRPPPGGAGSWVLGAGCWALGAGLQEARASSSLAWRRVEGPGEWVEGAGWLCREQRHSHEGKGLWGQRGTQEKRSQICRRAFLPWVPGECKLQGSNYTKSRNPLLDP